MMMTTHGQENTTNHCHMMAVENENTLDWLKEQPFEVENEQMGEGVLALFVSQEFTANDVVQFTLI